MELHALGVAPTVGAEWILRPDYSWSGVLLVSWTIRCVGNDEGLLVRGRCRGGVDFEFSSPLCSDRIGCSIEAVSATDAPAVSATGVLLH